MKHKVKLTVIDKKLYPELQQEYRSDPNSGMYPCYNAGNVGCPCPTNKVFSILC